MKRELPLMGPKQALSPQVDCGSRNGASMLKQKGVVSGGTQPRARLKKGSAGIRRNPIRWMAYQPQPLKESQAPQGRISPKKLAVWSHGGGHRNDASPSRPLFKTGEARTKSTRGGKILKQVIRVNTKHDSNQGKSHVGMTTKTPFDPSLKSSPGQPMWVGRCTQEQLFSRTST